MRSTKTKYTSRLLSFLCASLAFLSMLAPSVAVGKTLTQEQQIKQETEYAMKLVKFGFSDLAKFVTDKIVVKGGPASKGVKRVEIASLILQKKMKEAEEIIASLDMDDIDSWITLLGASEAFYSVGKWDRVKQINNAFFTKYETPPEGYQNFYKESAYKYAQILKNMREDEAVLKAYEWVLRTEMAMTIDEQLQVWTEASQIAFKLAERYPAKRAQYSEQAKKYAEKVQWAGWKGGGIWFGKSVVMFAQLELLNGNKTNAMDIITSYLPDIRKIHDFLVNEVRDPRLIKLTPLAECRFMLGKIYYDHAKELLEQGKRKQSKPYFNEALQHLFNVFALYPSSPWAPQAGKLSEEVIKVIEQELGLKVEMPENVPELGEVARNQLKEAQMLIVGSDFKTAIKTLTDIIELFPEFPGVTVPSLGLLAKCYYETGDTDYANSVSGYIIERFSQKDEFREAAGDALLTLASSQKDAGNTNAANVLYRGFIQDFTNHTKRASVLLYLGDVHRNEEEYDKALSYYRELKEGEEGYAGALSRIATILRKKGDFAGELSTLKIYINQEEPGSFRQAQATYRLASAYMNASNYPYAAQYYLKTEKMLDALTEKVRLSYDAKKQQQDLLKATLFNMGIAFSRVKKPESMVEPCHKKAVEVFTRFTHKFPRAEATPGAMLRCGVLKVILGDDAGANESFEKLGRLYPDSSEAKSMHFVRAKALVEMDFITDAKRAVMEMVNNAEAYTPGQFLVIAGMMRENGEREAAIAAYNKAMARTTDPEADRPIIERALYNLGVLYYDRQFYAEAAKSLKDLLEKYPRTGWTIDASFMLSRCYAELGRDEEEPNSRIDMFNASISALNTVARIGKKKPAIMARVGLESAGIYELRAEAENKFGNEEKMEQAESDAHAAYFRLFQFSDTTVEGVLEYVEAAFVKLIPLELEKKNFQDVIDFCDRYLEAAPAGKYVDQANAWRAEAAQNLDQPDDGAETNETGEVTETVPEPATEPQPEPAPAE